METLAPAALATVPRLHVTAVVPEQLRWVAVELTRLTPEGSVSARTTQVASDGPALATATV